MMQRTTKTVEKHTLRQTMRLIKRYKMYYVFFLPVAIYYFMFAYTPMPGIQIAFKDYTFRGGIWGSGWAVSGGELDLFKHFRRFLTNGEFPRLMKNTLTLTTLNLVLGFPAPIILALMLNEVRHEKYKKLIQTLTYLPHFVSFIVVYALLYNFFSLNGFVNGALDVLGMNRYMFLGDKNLYKWFYVGSGIWQGAGWGSIIYLAQLSRADLGQYEAAEIDGANRWQKLWHITLPCMRPLVLYQFVMSIGGILSVGLTKTMVMMNDMVRDVAETVSYYVYYTGLKTINQYSYSTAVGLFYAVLGLLLTIGANKLSKLIDEDGGIW